MKRLLVIAVATVAQLSAQGNTVVFAPLDGAAQAIIDAHRIANRRRQIELDEKRESRIAEQKTRALAQDRQANAATPRPWQPAPNPNMQGDTFDRAIVSVSSRHDDFDAMREQMARVHTMIENGSITAAEYVESLYLIAKFASFLNPQKSPLPAPPGVEKK